MYEFDQCGSHCRNSNDCFTKSTTMGKTSIFGLRTKINLSMASSWLKLTYFVCIKSINVLLILLLI